MTLRGSRAALSLALAGVCLAGCGSSASPDGPLALDLGGAVDLAAEPADHGDLSTPDLAVGVDLAGATDLSDQDLAAPADAAVERDLAVSDRDVVVSDFAPPRDLDVRGDLVTSDGARDAGGTDGGAQLGDPCGQSANGRACATGLACCYPCGIPGCAFQCAVPCAPGPGCLNGCELRP